MQIPKNISSLYDLQERVCHSVDVMKDCEDIDCKDCVLHHDHAALFVQFITDLPDY